MKGEKEMGQRILISLAVFLSFGGGESFGRDPIDDFVSTRCADSCTGESTACIDCQTEAKELFEHGPTLSTDDKDIDPKESLKITF